MTITVEHVLGSLIEGGRESLLLDIVDNSPETIEHRICSFTGDPEVAALFQRRGVDVEMFDIQSKSDVRGLFQMLRHFRSTDADVLHLHGPRAQIVGRVFGRIAGVNEIMSTQHGMRNIFPSQLVRLERATRPLESMTVAVSDGVKHSFIGQSDDPGWATVHNGIDVDAFANSVDSVDPSRVYDRHGLDDDELIYLNVGRYVGPKAQDDLLEAVDTVRDELPPSHVFIVGSRGGGGPKLKELLRERGLQEHATITGPVEDIHEYYAAADVYVQSSTSEGLPIVLLEAMASQLPIITTSLPGIEELVGTDAVARLVPPGEPELLGTALIDMSDEEARNRYATAGHERVRDRFDISNTVTEYAEIYEQLTDYQIAQHERVR